MHNCGTFESSKSLILRLGEGMLKVKSLFYFYVKLVKHPVPLFFAVLFLAAKIWSNVEMGAQLAVGLRSGFTGILMYGLALGIIHLLSDVFESRPYFTRSDSMRSRRLALPLMLMVYVFIMGTTVDSLQRLGYISGTPIYNYLPGYSYVITFSENVALWPGLASVPGLRDYMVGNILKGQLFFVVIPVLILLFLGFRSSEFTLTGGNLKPAVPFLVIYIMAFLLTGVTAVKWVFLIYALLYPAVCEEFFFRGVLQPLLIDVLRSPILGIGIGLFLFALIHVPDFVFRVYAVSLPLALSNVASVLLYGSVLAYGIYRSRMLWPWMVIHALSNVVGF